MVFCCCFLIFFHGLSLVLVVTETLISCLMVVSNWDKFKIILDQNDKNLNLKKLPNFSSRLGWLVSAEYFIHESSSSARVWLLSYSNASRAPFRRFPSSSPDSDTPSSSFSSFLSASSTPIYAFSSFSSSSSPFLGTVLPSSFFCSQAKRPTIQLDKLIKPLGDG